MISRYQYIDGRTIKINDGTLREGWSKHLVARTNNTRYDVYIFRYWQWHLYHVPYCHKLGRFDQLQLQHGVSLMHLVIGFRDQYSKKENCSQKFLGCCNTFFKCLPRHWFFTKNVVTIIQHYFTAQMELNTEVARNLQVTPRRREYRWM